MITRPHRLPLVARIATLLALTLVLGSPTSSVAKRPGGGGTGGGGTTDTTTKPPIPTNFRVTGKTAYTLTLAWDVAASTSEFNFHLSGTRIPAVALPKTARSHTFTALAPGNDYWLFIYTRDAAGNSGGQANLGPIVLPLDTTPPSTAPVVSIDEIGANYAHLSWTRALDDGPYHYYYELWINGSLLYRSNNPRDAISTVLRFLEPDTTYAVQIRTIDIGGNPSPISDPVAFTTLPANPNDTTPPTVPANLFAHSWGDLEMELTWTQSTDD